MRYKAIFADVDGTLIPPNAHPSTRASGKLIDTVLKAKRKGVEFSLMTARSLDWVAGLVSSLHITVPIILDNGARIYYPAKKKYISKLFIGSKVIKEVLVKMQQLNDIVYVVEGKESNERYETRLGDKINFHNVVKMMILHQLPVKADYIYQRLKNISDIQITQSISGVKPTLVSIHVTARGATKPNALNFIARKMNWKLEEIIGIGDSHNDLDLIKLCGLKVAMGNATEAVKSIADYVAPTYEKEGVAKTIEKYILNY